MGAMLGYLRRHPWQRRVLTGLVAMTAGGVGALLLVPRMENWRLLRDLGSPHADVREAAKSRAVARARRNPDTLDALERALAGQNDRRFRAALGVLEHLLLHGLHSPSTLRRIEAVLASPRDERFELAVASLRRLIRAGAAGEASLRALEAALEEPDCGRFATVAAALERLGEFHVPGRAERHVDRLRALKLEQPPPADPEADAAARADLLAQIVLDGRDNAYVRRCLTATTAHPAGRVRQRAALLAARLRDAETLRALLQDDEPAVRAAAAMDTGLAGVEGLAEPLAELLADGRTRDERSAAALALLRLAPEAHVGRIADICASTDDDALRDRLLHVLSTGGHEASDAVLARLVPPDGPDDDWPSAAAFLAAARRERPGLRGRALRLLAFVLSHTLLPSDAGPLLGALHYARRMDLPAAEAAAALLGKYGQSAFRLTLVSTARLLGERLAAGEADAADRPRLVAALRRRARLVLQTPWPAAAAAVALWQAGADDAPRLVRLAATAEDALAGDYVAWHISRLDGPRAFALGLEMLPPLDAPPEAEAADPQRRAAGAMLLALAADTEARRDQAVQRITRRLVGGNLGPEPDARTADSYRCALLMLGEAARRSAVRGLLGRSSFPARRACMALLAVGDRTALDWMLWQPGRTSAAADEAAADLLIARGLSEVLQAWAPALPAVDMAADDRLAAWQARVLRHDYALHREAIRLGPAS